MNRQGGWPGRGTFGRTETAYADSDAYQVDPYLEAGPYPVDPGFDGYAAGPRDQPRPADLPPGPPRGRDRKSVTKRTPCTPRRMPR